MSRDVSRSEVSSFWELLARMYRNLDAIRESSSKIVEYSDQIDALDTFKTFDQALKGTFDARAVRKTCSLIQKDVNRILSYAHEISPHLSNVAYVSNLSTMASLLLTQMSLPSNYLGIKLKEISLGARIFAQSSSKLVMSPTKKSVKLAFGIDIGSEWARLKAYIEKNYSNY